MILHLPLVSLREPAAIAKWLLIIFGAAALTFMVVPAFLEWRAGHADVLVWSIPILVWIVGPTALAAFLTTRVKSRAEAWLFVLAEVSAMISTAWLFVAAFWDRSPQNAQAVIGLILLPALQFPLLLSYASAVIGTALILRRR